MQRLLPLLAQLPEDDQFNQILDIPLMLWFMAQLSLIILPVLLLVVVIRAIGEWMRRRLEQSK